MKNPNCHKCIYRKSIPGDAHLECSHPKASFKAFLYLMSLPSIDDGFNIPPLNIQANIHGVKKGWFMWPMNFDPTWLENCDGYEDEINKG